MNAPPIDEGVSEWPPRRFEHLAPETREFFAALTPEKIAALNELRFEDVSTMRTRYRGLFQRGSAVTDDPIKELQTSVFRWIATLAGALVLSIVGGGLAMYVTVSSLSEWRDTHMLFHRDRATEIANDKASVTARVVALETQGRQLDRHDLRIGQMEEGLRSTNQRIDTSINQLNTTLAQMAKEISTLASDVRVLRSTVERQEARQGNGPVPFPAPQTIPARTARQDLEP